MALRAKNGACWRLAITEGTEPAPFSMREMTDDKRQPVEAISEEMRVWPY